MLNILSITLEENLEWNLHLSLLKSKLKRAIGLLCKIRYYVPRIILKTLYYTIFHSYLIYTRQKWGQSFNTLTKIQPLQDKAFRVINFNSTSMMSPLISDYIKMLSCLFIRDVRTNSTIPPFQNHRKSTSA